LTHSVYSSLYQQIHKAHTPLTWTFTAVVLISQSLPSDSLDKRPKQTQICCKICTGMAESLYKCQ